MLIDSKQCVDASSAVEGQDLGNQSEDYAQKFRILVIGQALCEHVASLLGIQMRLHRYLLFHDLHMLVQVSECNFDLFDISCFHYVFKQLKDIAYGVQTCYTVSAGQA